MTKFILTMTMLQSAIFSLKAKRPLSINTVFRQMSQASITVSRKGGQSMGFIASLGNSRAEDQKTLGFIFLKNYS